MKDASRDAVALAGWFVDESVPVNVAIATGEPSNTWVMDVDDMAALADLEAKYGPLPTTPVVETGRGGRHYYWRWTVALSDMKNAVKFAGALDVRTTGGYVLAPPSVHVSGSAYRWLVSPDDVPFAGAPAWLVDLAPKRGGTLTVHAAVDVDERARRYLAATPPAISGQRGHDHTFNVVCRLLEAFPELRARDDDELMPLLEAWNARCSPPWTENELRHKIRDARRKTASGTGTITIAPTPTLGVDTSQDPDADVAEEWPTLDPEACHGIAGEFVRAVEPHTEADPVALLVSFLDPSTLTRREPLRASNAHVSILGHITRDELVRHLDNVDVWNGFVNRFLWVLCRRSKLVPDASTPTLDALRQRLTLVIQGAKTLGEVKRTESAAATWREVYPSLVAEKRGLWDAATSRGEAHTLRLSLLYALLDGADTIDEPHLRAALALWRYCGESARLIFTAAADADEALETRIRRLVYERPGIMRTELRDVISHKIKATELEQALTWLAGRGEVERRIDTANGRRCERLYPVDGHGGSGASEQPTLTAPTPRCPDAPDTGTETGAVRTETPTPMATASSPCVDTQTESGLRAAETESAARALTPAEFLGTLAQARGKTDTPTLAEPATLAELLDWRNANGAGFVRRPDGTTWVTDDHVQHLTPALAAALHAYQDTLAAFVTSMPTSTPDVDVPRPRWTTWGNTPVTLKQRHLRLATKTWAAEPCSVNGTLSDERWRVGVPVDWDTVRWTGEVEGGYAGVVRWAERNGFKKRPAPPPPPTPRPACSATPTPVSTRGVNEADFFGTLHALRRGRELVHGA